MRAPATSGGDRRDPGPVLSLKTSRQDAPGREFRACRGIYDTLSPRYPEPLALQLRLELLQPGSQPVYLRLLDVPIPPIYGPTADENVPGF